MEHLPEKGRRGDARRKEGRAKYKVKGGNEGLGAGSGEQVGGSGGRSWVEGLVVGSSLG